MSRCNSCGTHLQKLDGVCAVCAARAVSSLLAISPPDAQPSVPGFVLHEQIGRGAMGVVYRAHRIADERTAAVKLLPEALLNDADIVDRFAREAHALAALDHRNILRVLDSGVTEQGQFFLATELAEGGDLAARLRLGPLPVSEVARIFREVLAAVSAAHERGIVHRDIKPANILLAADGAVLVGDFSIAKLLPEHAADSVTLTASGDSFGTPYYIAPEVRRGAPDVSEKADLFSLGVLLHELLTGRLPMGNYEPASQLAAVPRAVDAVIAHCLREAPGKRPASASALAREFDAALRPFPMWKKVALLTIGAVLAAGIATAWKKRSPAVAPQLSPTVASAKAPWRNSLGMQFVPVPGTRVLFSKWETRRADFGAFVSASLRPPAGRENEWKEPGFPTTPEHPVTPVSWIQCEQFCAWLTTKESSERRLPAGMIYRLPTDEEWSRAAELPPEEGTTPEARHSALGPVAHAPYAWGRTWPPPATDFPANFAGQETAGTLPPFLRSALRHRDAWAGTAPVGSFPENSFGVCDLSGNVSEWCLSAWRGDSLEKVIRGGCYVQSTPAALRLDAREHGAPTKAMPGLGFRIVLAPGNDVER